MLPLTLFISHVCSEHSIIQVIHQIDEVLSGIRVLSENELSLLGALLLYELFLYGQRNYECFGVTCSHNLRINCLLQFSFLIKFD